MDKREDIMRKIIALQDRTVDRGCSEAEAMSAAKIAARLLDEHGLCLSDIQIKERTDCEQLNIETGRRRAHEIQYCMTALAEYCDCKIWMNHGTYSLFGFPEDTKTVKWLYGIIMSSVAYELVKFKSTTNMTGKRESHAFKLGMVSRVSARLKEMKREQEQETKETTGRDLVIVKSQVVARQFETLGVRLGAVKRGSSYSNNHSAYAAGQSAGNRVGFNKGVGQQRYIS